MPTVIVGISRSSIARIQAQLQTNEGERTGINLPTARDNQ